MDDKTKTRFEQAGASQPSSLLGELLEMLRQNKKYWMIPMIIVLLAFGLLLLLGGTAAAPFIYTLF
jgi:hypothetical protein